MQREMRRINQELNKNACLNILDRNTAGVLALTSPDGHPYALPISYARQGEYLYFHCAPVGHKLDCIAHEKRASLCVIDQDEIHPEKFTTYFRSVIAFGEMEVIADEAKKREALNILVDKYALNAPGREEEINGAFHRVCVLALRMDSISGKDAIELVRQREKEKNP